MSKSSGIRWGRSTAVTSIIILLIVAASFFVINRINHMEEAKSFERLYEEADNLKDTIQMYAANDRETLELLAVMIAKYEDLSSTELWKLLDSYTTVGMMSRIELLLPDNTVLTDGGQRVDGTGLLSFEKEAALGAHITDRETDIPNSDAYVVRHYVPVTRNGVTVAMLYGVIELNHLPEDINMSPYGGKGAMYIIDGNTGDFLMDTWHSGETGNMWAMGERKMAPGYDPQQMRQGILNGESRYVVFVSETTGAYLYFYYEPLGINEWRIAVSVPESVVFENAAAIERLLNILLTFEVACFIAYFLLMIRQIRRVSVEKQRRLDALNDIYDVEKLLFNAHEKRENIDAALEKIGTTLSAEKVSFWIAGQTWKSPFLWESEPTGQNLDEAAIQDHFHRLQSYFKAGNNEFEAWDEKELMEMFTKYDRREIRNLAAVTVEDTSGNICGILESCNMANSRIAMVLLKNVKFSFGMFTRNLNNYTKIREMGDRDALTGLHNRNRYERDLPQFPAKCADALACVYIDADGLHELNNTSGHDEGDKMLQSVAEGIAEFFGTEYAYRTGGDEFILFLPDADESRLCSQNRKFTASLEQKGYHVSVGIQCETHVASMEALIKGAEQRMYEEKRKYYQQASNDRRRNPR